MSLPRIRELRRPFSPRSTGPFLSRVTRREQVSNLKDFSPEQTLNKAKDCINVTSIRESRNVPMTPHGVGWTR